MDLFGVLDLDACPIRYHLLSFEPQLLDLSVAVTLDFLPAFDDPQIALEYVWTQALSVHDFL